MKATDWQEIDADRAQILAVQDAYSVPMVRLAHPDLPRPRWFQLSLAGRYYSRYTGRQYDRAQGVIVVGSLPGVRYTIRGCGAVGGVGGGNA